MRYKLAIAYVKGSKVLDLACGSGYGSFILATEGEALSVTGYDLDEEAIRYGDIKYSRPNIKRAVKDALTPLLENEFDIVVSFETIEHLNQYESFLKNIYVTLKPQGLLIISTPIVEVTRTNCINPYHKIEWSFSDFQSLVDKYFSISEVFVQGLLFKEPPKKIIQRVIARIRRR